MLLFGKTSKYDIRGSKTMLQKSHEEVLNLAESFSNEELFSKGIFQWVGEVP